MDSRQRDELVIEHLAWAKKVARYRARNLLGVDHDDMESEGVMGLLAAASAFRPDAGVTFKSFARRRVEGAVVDAFRRTNLLEGRHASDQRKRGNDSWVTTRGKPRQIDIDVSTLDNGKLRPASMPSMGDGSECAELQQVIRRIMALPPRLASIVTMRYFGDMTEMMIAKRVGVSEARICQLLADARRLMGPR